MTHQSKERAVLRSFELIAADAELGKCRDRRYRQRQSTIEVIEAQIEMPVPKGSDRDACP